MRLRRIAKRARVEMLPLMDVVFLLLVFFIYAMMVMAVHRGMKVSLPTSGSAEREMASVLALTVKADGSLFLDREAVPLEGLAVVLKQRQQALADKAMPAVAAQGGGENAAQQQEVSLQVFAEDSLPYQQLYRVLDAIKEAGVRRVSLQAREGGVE